MQGANIQMIGGGYGITGRYANFIDPATGLVNFHRARPWIESKEPQISAMATLRKDEWKELDQAVVEVSTKVLNGIPDLRANGLAKNLGGIGTTISQYEKLSDMEDAAVSMSVRSAGEEDRATYTLVSVPVPVIHKEFRLDARALDASRRFGSSLDVTQAQIAARKVAEGLENMLFNGASNIVVNASALYGYTTHSDRNTASGSDWGTITNIYTNVNTMVTTARADNMRGPWILYVATTQFGEMFSVYTDGSGQTAYERCLAKIPGLQAIKEAPFLTAGTAVLVQMTSNVVDLVVGLDITTIQWETMGGMETRFKVMGIMAPRVKSDDSSQSGIVHITGI